MELPILARCVVLDDGESVVAGDGVERSATHALILETEFSKLLEEKRKKRASGLLASICIHENN